MTTTVGYATKGQEIVTIDGPNITLLDAMMEAQHAIGFGVTWIKLTETVARGTFEGIRNVVTTTQHGTGDSTLYGQHRVIAIDLDNADVHDAVAATMWVNE